MLKTQGHLHGAGRALPNEPAARIDPSATTAPSRLESFGPSEGDDIAEAAQSIAVYIAQMTEELGKLARAARLDLLTYLLNIVRLEAECRSARPPVLGRASN
jgi:hypothetical protein